MKGFRSFALLSVVIFAVSCRQEVKDTFVPSPYVQNIISDRTSPENLLLSSYTSPAPSGDIVLAGSVDRCRSFTQILLSSDHHDNVTGSHVQDGLLDFSGEKFVTMSSETDSFQVCSAQSLEVSQLICALDTSYHLSPYDVEGIGHKNRAKLLVYANPSSYVFCKKDIDFLTGYFRSSIPILFPLEETVRRCLMTIDSDAVTIGFVTDSSSYNKQAYDLVLSEVTEQSGKTVNTCFSFIVPDGCPSPLFSFIDAYLAAGNTQPLDAVIVDTYVADMSYYEAARTSIGSVLSPESLIYGKYVSENFSVIGVYDTTADVCYHIMRDRNLFTHNIALPYSESFSMVQHPDTSQHSYISVPYVI